MKMNIGKLMTGGMVAAALMFPILTADDEVPEAKLSDWSVGKTVRGEEVKAEDLEGKVVVIEYWGVQ